MKWPSDRFLVYLISWLAAGWGVQLGLSIGTRTETWTETLSREFGLFIIGIVGPMMYGAILSDLSLIAWSAFACGVVFIITLTAPPFRSALAAKLALSAYFVLSMLTLWIEPWIILLTPWINLKNTLRQGLTTAMQIFLGISTMIPDVFITLFAMVLLKRAFSKVDGEFSDSSRPHNTSPHL